MSGVPSLSDALKQAVQVGLVVTPVRRTGEKRVAYPWGGPSIRVNNRRRDASTALLRMIDTMKEQRP